MNIFKDSVNRQVFSVLMMDLFAFYKKEIQAIKPDDPDTDTYEVICRFNNQQIFKPPRSFGKYIFTKKGDDYYDNSIGAVLAKQFESGNQKTLPDFSDFIYKRCNEYNKSASNIAVYSCFYEILGYKSIKEFCAKKDLEYNESSIAEDGKVSKSKNYKWESRLETRLQGTWRLYFYNNEGFGSPTLATAILEVADLNNLKLTNKSTDASINYYGKIDDGVTKVAGVVYLKFNPENKRETRNLRIALHISEDQDNTIAIGHYTNIDSERHLIRGSICMENMAGLKNNTDKLSPEFERFLANKNLNFNRLPNSQYNLVSFRNWLDEQKMKRRYQRIRSINENKKLFISCPIHSVSAEQFQELKQIVKKIETHFKEKEGFTKVNSFISGLEHQKDKSSTPDRIEYQKVVEMFNESSYYMALWPLDLQLSGIIFEIGWAVMQERPVAIFEQVLDADDTLAKSQIPHLLRGGCGAKRSGIERYTFEKFDGILNILKSNELEDIFINPHSTD